jgi:glutamine amidotransferase
LHPELEVLRELGDETRLIVSEPLRDLPGAWNEVPESSWGMVRSDSAGLGTFTPVRSRATV